MTPKARVTTKKEKNELLQSFKFRASIDIIKKVKRQTEWEKTCANHAPAEKLTSNT